MRGMEDRNNSHMLKYGSSPNDFEGVSAHFDVPFVQAPSFPTLSINVMNFLNSGKRSCCSPLGVLYFLLVKLAAALLGGNCRYCQCQAKILFFQTCSLNREHVFEGKHVVMISNNTRKGEYSQPAITKIEEFRGHTTCDLERKELGSAKANIKYS